jgi:RimJ/RimL family protein N-acetyltransferase
MGFAMKEASMATFSLAPELSDDVLVKRRRLPNKPEGVTLAGSHVRLEPLDLARHVETLFTVSNGSSASWGERSVGSYDADALIWRYMSGGPFTTADDLEAWLRVQVESPTALCLTVFDVPSARPVGAANLMGNFPEHLKIELGNIWYSPIVQGTQVSREATYLMLRHVFDLGYRRVEWKCDALNERSRRAALGMGFTFEGIQEQHFIVKDRNRDTAWVRILDHEWPDVRSQLAKSFSDL